MAANGGKKPTHEQLAAALRNSEWDSPAGKIRMALGGGHQAIQDTAIGRTKYDAAKKMVMIEDIVRFPAECVNPPANMDAENWIKAGFPGALSLLLLVPVANIIFPFYLAFAEWPALRDRGQ